MQLTTQQTMSSREIAELTKSRHDAVKKSALRLANNKLITSPVAKSDFNHNGNVYKEYHFNKRDSLVLVARLSPEFTAAIVDRWQELEAKQLHPALPANYIEALESLVAAEKEKSELSQQLQIAAPKVEYHDRVLATDNGITTTEIAAELGMSARKLNDILAQMKVQRKIGNRWVLTAANLNKGYDVEVTHVDDGGKSRHAMKWSESGRKFIHELINT